MGWDVSWCDMCLWRCAVCLDTFSFALISSPLITFRCIVKPLLGLRIYSSARLLTHVPYSLTGLLLLIGIFVSFRATENILLTSWGMLFLTDIAFYKPTFLPASNPADYAFFFDSAHQRK